MLADEKQLAALVDLFHTGTKHEFSKGEETENGNQFGNHVITFFFKIAAVIDVV